MALTPRVNSSLANFTEGVWVPFSLIAGNNTVVAGGAGQIVVWHVIFTAATGVLNVTLKSGTTAFSGTLTASAASLEYFQDPLICASGQSFVITSDNNGGGMVFCQQG